MIRILKSVATLSSLVLLTATAQAETERTTTSTFPKAGVMEEAYKPHVGLLAGITNGEGTLGSGAEYGIDAGYQPYVPFGVGMEISSATVDRDQGIIDDQLVRTKLLIKGTYNFGGTIPVVRDSYVGLASGALLESIANSDRVYLGVMPLLGFDIPLQDKPSEFMSAGLNARYLISSSGEPNSFSVNGVLKYWF